VSLFTDIAALDSEGRPFVLATVIATQGSTPQKAGSKLVVLENGELRGTVGGGAIEKQIIEAALALFAAPGDTRTIETHLTHDLGMCCGGRMTVFLERIGAPPALFIFGAGHVSKELCALAAAVGFRVTVSDTRAEWLTEARFPAATRLLSPCDDVARTVEGGPNTYCCVMTHDHPLDQACVEVLLPRPLRYLGVIGSRRKAERFRARLRQAGFPEEQIARLESPMGLPIEAETPQEIAVSMVAQLIAVRRAAPVALAPAQTLVPG
jgi:xanthine dehydrogenase accessory factor